MRNRNTYVQHTRVLRKTLCVRGLGFAFVLERDCTSREFVERLVVADGRPLAPHRQAHTLGILPSTKPFLLRRPFRVAVANRSILLR